MCTTQCTISTEGMTADRAMCSGRPVCSLNSVMLKRIRISVLLLLALPAFADSVPAKRQQELKGLLYQDCGSCHGMKLTGGLGPALTPAALQGKSVEFLVATIQDGRPGTPMPPWKALLSDTDIVWLANYLKNPGGTQ